MNFKGKKVAVIGAGIEGFSSASFLVSKGALVTLFDQKNENQLDKERKAKIKNLQVKFISGKNYLADLSGFDYIFRSPGVKPDLPELVKAREKGAAITSQTKAFFDLCTAQIIGVTGTKGKGTTASLFLIS
jgi:UDP-N-acetylmuramoylalanine--D-glutamate ligase